jgi:HEAT repeat protein
MTTKHEIVRTGNNRSARRGRSVLIIVGAALLAATVARAKASVSTPVEHTRVASQDTTMLNEFLAKLRGVDPLICQLVGRSLNNRWGPYMSGLMISSNGPAFADGALLEWVNRFEIDRAMVPRLRAALADTDGCVRQTAAQVLGRAQVVDLSAELRAELTSTNPRTREAAVSALGYFDKQSGLDEARAALRDADMGVRKAGVWALGMIESSEAVSALAEFAADPDPGLRRMVAWALGNIESSAAVTTLTRMLGDADPSVRVQAAHALGQIESSDAIPALIKLLNEDRDPAVRRAAAIAIGQISG